MVGVSRSDGSRKTVRRLIPFRQPNSLMLSNMKQTRRSLDLVLRNRTETYSRHVLSGGPAGLTAIRRAQAIGEYEAGFGDRRGGNFFNLHAMIENETIAHE